MDHEDIELNEHSLAEAMQVVTDMDTKKKEQLTQPEVNADAEKKEPGFTDYEELD